MVDLPEAERPMESLLLVLCLVWRRAFCGLRSGNRDEEHHVML